MVGNDEATAQKKMEAVMAIETRIAKASYSQVQLRDIDKNYHKMTYNQLVLDYPGIDWGNVFLASGFRSPAGACFRWKRPFWRRPLVFRRKPCSRRPGGSCWKR